MGMGEMQNQNQSTPQRLAAITLCCACLAYLLALSVAAALLWTVADQWWPVTVLLFAPRWILAMPMIVLVPVALAAQRKSLITLAVAAAVLAWPIMGLHIPWNNATDSQTPFLRFLTCNTHRGQLDPEAFKSALADMRPDVVALQDWSSEQKEGLFERKIWNSRRDGELYFASRWPISNAKPIHLQEPPPAPFRVRLGAAEYYRLLTPLGAVSVINVHLASPHEALQAMREFDHTSPEQLAYNMRCRDLESATIQAFAARLRDPLVILGDFNTPDESVLYRQYWQTFTNAFSAAGFGFGSTHVSSVSSVRIDHILLGNGWATRNCWLAAPAGSPHRPLVADLELSTDKQTFASDDSP
jgi:endonuclease/exonuclease/phosphatase family metal-dependent hydrolase